MREERFNPDSDLFPYILKPARYLGGERGALTPAPDAAVRLLLFYPAEYETAVGDVDFLRLYAILNTIPGVAAERAALFAPDAQARLAELGAAPFSLESRRPWTDFNYLVFFIADPLHAACIPEILRKVRESGRSLPPIAVVSAGHVIPHFLTGIADLIVGDVSFTGLIAKMGEAMGFAPQDAVARLSALGVTPQLVPSTGAVHDELRIPLFAGPMSSPALFAQRSTLSVARDTLLGVGQTGFEDIRFLSPRGRVYPDLPDVFAHLSLRENLARHHFAIPALPPEMFLERWSGFRPHFLKPELPLLFPAGQQVSEAPSHPVAEAGPRALTLGWQIIVLVYPFAHWEDYRNGLSSLVALADFINEKCKLHEDRRLARVQWLPAAGENWRGPLEYGERIQAALRSIHQGALHRLPGETGLDAFDPVDELARQVLLRLGPEHLPMLEGLTPRFPELRAKQASDILTHLRERALNLGLKLPEFGEPVDLTLSPFLCGEGSEAMLTDDCSGEPQELPVVADVFGRQRRKRGFTRRLTPVPMRRLRVQYAKEAPLRFCSHLDVVRTVERAFRRSRLPVAYSEGFHPRPKISFGPPLPLGVVSRAEYLDLVLDQDFEPAFVESLKQQFPPGLVVLQTLPLPLKVMSLFERINLLAYRVTLPGTAAEWQERIAAFLAQDTVFVDRATEDGTRRVNIRPHVQALHLTQSEGTLALEMELLLSERGTVRPAEALSALAVGMDLDPRSLVVERTQVYIQEGGRRTTPMEAR